MNKQNTHHAMTQETHYDVTIIGGSYAGLSAAMALGRSLRKVLIIDSGLPCNRQTPHSHNFITHDGSPPALIASRARQQVLQYPSVSIIDDIATKGAGLADGFGITTAKGRKFTSQKLIFATGIKDIMPDIKGFAECWGISVIHCPYCHGYEFRHRPTGIMANGDRAFHLASLVNNLTDSLTLFTNGEPAFNAEQWEKLNKHHIKVVDSAIAETVHTAGQLKHLVLADGSKHPLAALYASLPFEQHCNIPIELGCELTEQGYLKTDPMFKTTIPGIYACGDNANMMRSVANAVYSGNMAGAAVNHELTAERF